MYLFAEAGDQTEIPHVEKTPLRNFRDFSVTLSKARA